MPIGTRHRLEGLLLNSKRGLVLQMDDGGVWALDHDRSAAKLVGLRVIVVSPCRSVFEKQTVVHLTLGFAGIFDGTGGVGPRCKIVPSVGKAKVIVNSLLIFHPIQFMP